MNHDHFDHRLLITVLAHLDDPAIQKIRENIGSDDGLRERFEYVLAEAQKLSRGPGQKSEDSVELDWELPSNSRCVAFVKLLDFYFDRKKRRLAEKGIKFRVSDLFTAVSNNAKWNRMKMAGGEGVQYHDDVRRVCILLELSYLEATELLWNACQPFDRTSQRDKIIAECLCKKIYDEWEVNAALEKAGVSPPLFPMDD